LEKAIVLPEADDREERYTQEY